MSGLKNFILLILMLAASGFALALRPTYKIAEQCACNRFGNNDSTHVWRLARRTAKTVAMVDPQQKELIDKIYTQTLSRTYVNSHPAIESCLR